MTNERVANLKMDCVGNLDESLDYYDWEDQIDGDLTPKEEEEMGHWWDDLLSAVSATAQRFLTLPPKEDNLGDIRREVGSMFTSSSIEESRLGWSDFLFDHPDLSEGDRRKMDEWWSAYMAEMVRSSEAFINSTT